MSAVLRAHGTDFDVDAFIAKTCWADVKAFHRGEPKFPRTKPSGDKCSMSGLMLDVSNADFDAFQTQIKDAMQFLQSNAPEVKRLVSFKGVDGVVLDFAIARRNVFVQSDTFPAEMVRLAGECRISLEQSHYPPISANQP